MTNEEALVKIKVNSQEATREVDRLEKKVSGLREEFTNAFKKGDTKEIARLTKEINKTSKELQTVRTNAQNVQSAMKRLDEATPKELRRTIKQINDELNSGRVKRGSKEWDEYVRSLNRVKAELKSVQTSMAATETPMQRIGSNVKKFWGLYAAGAGVAIAAWGKLENAMTSNMVKEDSKANLQALTGLGDADVNWLTEQAGKLSTEMDKTGLRCTQSATEILNAFMLVGSNKPELLSSKEGLAQVTTEAIRLATAAKMDLEPAVNAMTTALNQYGAGADEAAKYVNVLAAGSKVGAANVEQQSAAILNAGTAAASANVPIEQLVGCIEMLGEKGIKSEVAGTGLKKLFMVLQTGAADTNPKVVGLSQALDTLKAKVDAAEAQQVGGGASFLKKMFGEEGYSTVSIITSNIDKLKEYTQAVTDTDIATQQAAKNSSTMSAQLAQMKNQVNAAVGSLAGKLTPVFAKLIPLVGSAAMGLGNLVTFLAKNKAAVLALVGAFVSYQLSLVKWSGTTAAATLLQKGWNAILTITHGITNTLTAAYNLCAAGVFKLTGNTAKATEAMNAFKAASSTNIFGAIAAVLSTLAVVMMTVGKKTGEVSAKTEALNTATQRAAEGAEAEKQALQANIEKLAKFNGSRAEELELCAALNQKYGPVLGTYNTVAQWLSVLKKRGDEYTKTVYAQIEAEAKLEAARQLIGQAAKLRAEASQIDPDYYNKLMAHVNKFGNRLSLPVSPYPAGEVGIYRPGGEKGTPEARVDEKLNQAEKLEKSAKELTDEAAKVNKTVGAVTPAMTSIATTATAPATGTPSATGAGNSSNSANPGKAAIRTTAKDKEKEEAGATKAVKDELVKRTQAVKEAEAANFLLYQTGQRSYVDFMKERDRIQAESLDARIVALEKAGYKETQVYKSLKKEREKMANDEKANGVKYDIHQLERQYKDAASQASADFLDPSSSLYNNQKALNQRLFELDVELLKKKQALYEQGSDEWIALQEQIADKVNADQLAKAKELAEALKQARDTYGNADGRQQMEIQSKLIDQLHQSGLISEEEYLVAVQRLRQRYSGASENKSALGTTDLSTPDQKKAQRQAELDAELAAEKSRFEKGEIQQEEYERNCDAIRKTYRDKAREDGLSISNEYADMVTGLFDKVQAIFDPMADGTMLEKITAFATAAVQVMSSIIGSMTSYANACRDLELAKVEKNYDAQIKAAGKNQRKAKKLEEQKQAETAKIKKKYNDKAMAMELAQAVAQTAVATINAYASASKVNWLLGPIAAAMATAAGLVQIATIKKQHEAEAAGYYSGGFTTRSMSDRKEVGVVHANEFVANHQAVANPALAPILALIDHAQRTNTIGSLTSSDVAAVLPYSPSATPAQLTAIADNSAIVEVVSSTSQAQAAVLSKLNESLEAGINAYVVLDGEQGLDRKYTRYKQMLDRAKR